MLNNYEMLPSGVVKQKRIKRARSTQIDYFTYYEQLGVLNEKMSMLRIGYILGVINQPKSILDIGYGNGSFLKNCLPIVPNCYGYDINPYPLPKKVIHVNSMHNRKYDVITMFDALEHFSNIDFVAKLKCDFMVISVPECHNAKDTEWFINWRHRKPDEHIFHFSKNALLKFMALSGYTCISLSNMEDTIRGNLDGRSNILTGIFKKIS